MADWPRDPIRPNGPALEDITAPPPSDALRRPNLASRPKNDIEKDLHYTRVFTSLDA